MTEKSCGNCRDKDTPGSRPPCFGCGGPKSVYSDWQPTEVDELPALSSQVEELRGRVNELEREAKALRSNTEGFGKSVCGAVSALERERDEARSRVEKLEGDLAAALSDHSFEYAACEEQRKRAEAAEKCVEIAGRRIDLLEEALRYIASHLEHGGLSGGWKEPAKMKVMTALNVSKALAERQEASNG